MLVTTRIVAFCAVLAVLATPVRADQAAYTVTGRSLSVTTVNYSTGIPSTWFTVTVTPPAKLAPPFTFTALCRPGMCSTALLGICATVTHELIDDGPNGATVYITTSCVDSHAGRCTRQDGQLTPSPVASVIMFTGGCQP